MAFRIIPVTIACLGMAVGAAAQAPQSTVGTQPPQAGTSTQQPLSRGEMKTVTVTVESVDYAARSAVLKTADGKLFTVQASSDVTRFDKLKVGDKITATYYESIVLTIATRGKPPVKATDEGKIVPTTGEKPGGTA